MPSPTSAEQSGFRPSLRPGGPKPFYQLTREPLLFTLVIIILALLGLFIVYPLFAVTKMSLTGPEGGFSAEVYKYVFTHHRYKKAIGNSC